MPGKKQGECQVARKEGKKSPNAYKIGEIELNMLDKNTNGTATYVQVKAAAVPNFSAVR
jgi:hypothetical protein